MFFFIKVKNLRLSLRFFMRTGLFLSMVMMSLRFIFLIFFDYYWLSGMIDWDST